MKEKILTKEIVVQNGWHELEVITADMLDGYTEIGYCAFRNCTSLTSVTISKSVTSIRHSAFYACSGLTSVIISNSIISIGDYAFANCSGLTSVTIPNSVTSIGYEAFKGCSGLTSITIPNSVTSIRSHAFSYCSGLTSISVESGNTHYDSRNNCNALIETTSNTLIAGCNNTIIPNSVTSIGNSAFLGCSGLTSITIPNSVTSIGNSAFSRCSGLTSVTIPNSVTSIGNYTFVDSEFKIEKRYDEKSRLIAYKGFNLDKSCMSCRDFQYEEGKTYEIDDKIKLCKQGFHACINPLDCLNYYSGEIGKNVIFHEVYLEDVSNEIGNDSKVVARKITIGREITLSEMADIASGRK